MEYISDRLEQILILLGEASQPLTSAQLEEKVKLHNSLVERMTAAEEKIKSNSHRITDLERLEREE